MPNRSNNHILEKSTLLLAAIGLAAFEFFIPRIPIFPWLKPGLANCVTLLWIIRFGALDALLFILLRIWTLGFYFGFSFFTLTLSLSGGIAATLVMGLLWHSLGKRKILGLVGIGICGALVHNAAQLIAVFVLMARNMYLFYQIPIMLSASVFFGTIVSLLVPLLDNLSSPAIETGSDSSELLKLDTVHKASAADTILSSITFLFCIALIFIPGLYVLSGAAIAVTITVQIIERGSFKAFIRPISRFWMLFLAIGAFHLLLSYGTRIESIPIVTYEGLYETSAQWLRIWTWLQVASILRKFQFHLVFFSLLQKIFHRQNDTIYAGLLALECFPAMIDAMRKNATKGFSRIFAHPIQWARNAVSQTFKDVSESVKKEA